MEYIPYNATSEVHKQPFGAVKDGEEVCFRVVLPRNLMCEGVDFVYHEDGQAQQYIPMNWESMQGDSEEWWSLLFSFDKSGLYFYHFEFKTAFGTSQILHDGSFLGSLNGGLHEWQITVYQSDFETPSWLKGGLIYQIFPDRFNCSGKKHPVVKDRIYRNDWGGEPMWRPDENGKVLNNDYFGGDLEGIRQKLPYLSSLGVSCIYLNPIFEAHSNHRYNTADYSKIDYTLGDEDDLKKLCFDAKKYGISVMLDGVFSHTGDDSIYFNRYGRYKSNGAFNSTDSPYFSWFKFSRWPNKYESWWGFETLPETQEESPEYLKFITGKNGIARKWLRAGIRGWRLDVADELPDGFLDAFRSAVKEENPDAIILGEVWEDASTKFAYGDRRRYLQGKQLDSVMNYPFAEAIIDFVRTGTAEGFFKKILSITENYPKCVVDILMNHIGTHDTARAITRLVGESSEYRDRQWQSEQTLTPSQYNLGVKLLKLASLIQYTLPGVPSLYYGDEVGMVGYKDPFNRGCYPWGNENEELLEWYRFLGKIRKEISCLADGRFYPVSEMLGCVCYVRSNEYDSMMVIANRNNHEIVYTVPDDWADSYAVLGSKKQKEVTISAYGGAILRK